MGNTALNPTQTNCLKGVGITAEAAVDLTGLEGYLAVLGSSSGTVTATRPTGFSSLALYLIDQGDEAGEVVDLSAINPGEQFRVVLKGAITAGARLALYDPTAAAGVHAGKVAAVPVTQGVYFSPGIAEEDGVDGQNVLIRFHPELLNVGTAFTSAAPAATAPTNSTPYGFTQAQAQAILTNLIELRAFAVAQGWKATA